MGDSGSKRAQDRPEPEGVQPSAQVLQFRPRERGTRGGPLAKARQSYRADAEPVDDLAQYEQDNDERIDYPQRMLMNTIALVVVAVLIGLGVWLANSIGRMEREQDCMLQGRKNCAPIEVAAPMQK